MLALLASSIVGLGLSGGIGSSYDYLGVRLDLRIWHVAASVALGVSGVYLLDPGSSYGLRNVQIAPALGLRAFSGDSEGSVAAVNRTGHRYKLSRDNPNSFDPTARLDTLAAGEPASEGPWYGYQTLLVDGAAVMAGAVAFSHRGDSHAGDFPSVALTLGIAASAAWLAGAPIVHVAHGRDDYVARSILLRLGSAAAAGLLSFALYGRGWAGCTACAYGIFVVIPVAIVIPIAIDGFSREEIRPPLAWRF
jgi:hypothetical protein